LDFLDGCCWAAEFFLFVVRFGFMVVELYTDSAVVRGTK
jgi:hypothetical protein